MKRERAAQDRTIEEANAELVDGLKSCRSVVETYKSLLLPTQVTAAPSEDVPAEPDTPAAPNDARE